MKLTEYADIINREIEIMYHPNTHTQEVKYSAHFRGAEVKKSVSLTCVWGRGNTPEEAMDNYFEAIAGKTLVFDASSKRTVFTVPEVTEDGNL